jgi:hypothetical protein
MPSGAGGVLARDNYTCIYCGIKVGDLLNGRPLSRRDLTVDTSCRFRAGEAVVKYGVRVYCLQPPQMQPAARRGRVEAPVGTQDTAHQLPRDRDGQRAGFVEAIRRNRAQPVNAAN